GGGPVAVWATVATTRSRYQQGLIEEFGRGVEVTPVACAGLAEAVESADPADLDAAVAYAAERTAAPTAAGALRPTHHDLLRAQRPRRRRCYPAAPTASWYASRSAQPWALASNRSPPPKPSPTRPCAASTPRPLPTCPPPAQSPPSPAAAPPASRPPRWPM